MNQGAGFRALSPCTLCLGGVSTPIPIRFEPHKTANVARCGREKVGEINEYTSERNYTVG